jgi:hypothetical protein
MVRVVVGPDRGPDRAQLLVVGALVLAFLIVGLVPVYNAVFAADSAGNGEPTELSAAAVTVEGETTRLARELAVRVAHRDHFPDNDSLATAYGQALDDGTGALGEAYVRGGDRSVSVTFDPDAPGTTYSVRAVQAERGRFDDPATGAPDWTVVDGSRVGWAVARLETANLSDSQPLVIRVDNGSDELAVKLERTDAGDDVRVTVTGTVGATPEDVTCEPRSGEVVVDLYRGRSASRDCEFMGLSRVAGPVELTVENGDSARVAYELVARRGDALNGGVLSCTGAPTSRPCSSPALWQVALETRVAGSRTSYVRAANVSVYGGGA